MQFPDFGWIFGDLNLGWVFGDLGFRAVFFSFWILEQVLTVGIPGHFFDFQILDGFLIIWILEQF